jgi:lipoprotein NlpD
MSASITGLDFRGSGRALATVLLAMLVAGCGSTRVIRAPVSRAPAPHVSAPKYGATATVRQGQTLYRIAVENGISPLDLAMWNTVPPPYVIYPGQRLRLYPPDHSAARSSATTTVAPRITTAPPRSPVGSVRAPTVVSPPVQQPTAPPSSSLTWAWPADGTISSRYVAGEPTRQGIDITGAEGQPIRAAADGVVVYSGSGLVGYGELIIVKHNDAWLSAYGHNRSRMVNEGQRVTAGQQIAQMGHTGAAHDLLHFEIRFNGKPVDPMAYLPPRRD